MIVVEGPLGKLKCRIKFQGLEITHIHPFLPVTNEPVLGKDNIDIYQNFVDFILKMFLKIPD